MDDRDRARLYATFRSDAERRLESIERALLTLESSGDGELLGTLFRDLHTVKGDALTVGMRGLGELLHAAEDLVERMVGRGAVPEQRSTSLLLAVVDRARLAIDRQAAGAAEAPREDVAELIGALRSFSAFGKAAAPQREGRPERRRRTVEVTTSVLDELVRLVGEIGRYQRSQAASRASAPGATPDTASAGDASEAALAVLEDLERAVLGMRTVPLKTVVQSAERAARDLALSLGKSVRLDVSGADVAVDFTVRDVASGALVHLVRNAIDHGIEEPEERAATGKDAMGTLAIGFAIVDGDLSMTVSDDGRGIDPDRLRERAVELGLPAPDTHAALLALLLTPGFSTRADVTDISGRGVGLDAVAAEVRASRGRLQIASEPGRGLSVTVRVPLSVAIVEVLLVEAGGGRFLLPTRSITSCRRFDRARTSFTAGDPTCGVYTPPGADSAETSLAFVELAAYASSVASRATAPAGADNPPRGEPTLIEVRTGATRAGIVVDVIRGVERVVIAAPDPVLRRVPYLLGTAVLADGGVGLVLEVQDLVRHVAMPATATRASP